MPATLDLRKAHSTRQHGDLLVVFTWINDERAMVLVPAYRPGAPWYVVAESASFRYDDPKYVAVQCVKACEVLGIKPSKENWARLSGIIVDSLPDLIRMPSAPPPDLRPGSFGAMTLRADGQVLVQQDIRLEREGVTYG
jgi:hypothetical protein